MTLPYSCNNLIDNYKISDTVEETDYGINDQVICENLPVLEPHAEMIHLDSDVSHHFLNNMARVTDVTVSKYDNKTTPIQQIHKKKASIYTFQPDHLAHEKGLIYLINQFPKIQFLGDGHEVEDIVYLIYQYQSWGNRMFPKFKFTDLLDRIDVFGSRAEIQQYKTCIRNGKIVSNLKTLLEKDEMNVNIDPIW